MDYVVPEHKKGELIWCETHTDITIDLFINCKSDVELFILQLIQPFKNFACQNEIFSYLNPRKYKQKGKDVCLYAGHACSSAGIQLYTPCVDFHNLSELLMKFGPK